MGRVRLRRIPNATADSLQEFVKDAVESGSLVLTDGLLSYDRLVKHGYRHRIRFVKGSQRSGVGAAALGPPGHCAAGALAARHAPRGGVAGTSGLLPRRIHVPIQPADLSSPQTVLPFGAAGGGDRPGTLRLAR